MRIYAGTTVLEAALDRIRWLFDEFPTVIVNDSGGKDSTVIFHLTLQVAREKNRLPLDVMWLDQEAEWEATVDQVRSHMYHPDVRPHWYQIPMRLFNATSVSEHWLQCWDPEARDLWMHEQDPIAITENRFGTDRFAELFVAISKTDFPGKTVQIAGVRAEESPSRLTGLTHYQSYKWATWGNKKDAAAEHWTMYPIYDWSYTDVWKAIHTGGWPYNRIYDAQYRYGVPVQQMRVSNVHHETAVNSLFYMPELEPETWNRLTGRLAGIDMAGKMGAADYVPTDLPPMFSSWSEYRDYLLEHLIADEDWRRRFRVLFSRLERRNADSTWDERKIGRTMVRAILLNDWEGVTLSSIYSKLRKDAGWSKGRKLEKLAR